MLCLICVEFNAICCFNSAKCFFFNSLVNSLNLAFAIMMVISKNRPKEVLWPNPKTKSKVIFLISAENKNENIQTIFKNN